MKKLLLVVSCAELLALAVWIGGLIVIIAAVIPAVFNSASMEIGGRLLMRTFQGYDRLVLIAAALLLVGMLTRACLHEHGNVGMLEASLIIAMIAVALILIAYVNPQTVGLQEAAFTANDEAAKRVTYTAFFRYHWLARGLYLVNLGLGVIVMCVKVRRWVR